MASFCVCTSVQLVRASDASVSRVYSSPCRSSLNTGEDSKLSLCASKAASCLSFKMRSAYGVPFVRSLAKGPAIFAKPLKNSRKMFTIHKKDRSSVFVLGGSTSASPAVFFESASIVDPNLPSAFKGLIDRSCTDIVTTFSVLRMRNVQNYSNSVSLGYSSKPILGLRETRHQPRRRPFAYHCRFDQGNTKRQECKSCAEQRAFAHENRNAYHARALQYGGFNVKYGMTGLKVHCKTMLVTR